MVGSARELWLRLTNLKYLLIGFAALTMGTAAAAADLQVTTYSVNPDPAAESVESTFTVTVANNGGAAVPNAVVTIAIPSNYDATTGTFPAFCSVSGAVGSQTLTCNLPPLAQGSPQTITFTAIADSAGAANTTATISAAGNVDNNSGNDFVTITPTVRSGADLTVSKAGSAPNVIAGGQLTYTLTVNNAGPSATGAVRVIDNLPAASDFDFASATGSGWSCSRSGQTVTCDFTGAAPAPGANYPDISITGEVVSASAGTISNIANVVGTDPLILDPDELNNNSNTVVTNVDPGSDLIAQKSMPGTITVGSTATIRLTINNSGPQTVPAGVTISDTIDSSLSIGTLPAGCALSGGQTVTCTAGSLNAPGQAVFDIPVTAVAATGGQINNVASITPVAGFADPDATNNTVSVPFEVVEPNADLRLRAKNKFPNPVAPGSNVTSRIFVRNDGPSVASYSAANPLIITDQLGPDETFVSGPADFDCTTAPNAGGTLVTCRTNTTGTVAVGADIRLDLITTAGAGFNGTITNEACADTTAGSMHTPSSASSPSGDDCRSGSVTATTSDADLTIDKSVSLSPSSGFSGNLIISDTVDVFYIQLVARNRTGDPAANVRVRDVFPNLINSGGLTTGVTLESFTTPTAPSFNYQPNNNRADINFNNLVVGSPQTFVLRVERPFGSGTFTNTASIFSSNTTETDNSNNSDTANYTIGPVADMTINSKTITPDPAQVGVPATYIINVRNDGANPADAVEVIDVIDPNLFDIIGTPTTTKPGGSCAVVTATGTVTCSMGQFIRDEVRQVSIQVLPKFPFGATAYTNRATVTTSSLDSNGGTDPNAGNNFFDLMHDVDPPEFDLTVTKVESNPATDDPIRFDETLNYDIRASNFGPSRATDILVTDFPAPPAGLTMTLNSVTINPIAANGGLTLQAAPNAGCSTSGGNVLCRVDTGSTANNFLDSGSQVIFRLTFTIGGTPPATTTTFSNAVEITSAEQPTVAGAGADTQTINNRAVQNTTVLPATDLEIVSKTRSGALVRSVNEPVEYIIRFRNNGPSSTTGVEITDVLPAGMVFTNSTAPSTSIPGGSSATVSGLVCTGTTTIVCEITGNFPAGAGETVDLSVFAVAQEPYSGATAPTDLTNTVTITPGDDGFGNPLSEDPVGGNNDGTANTQISPSSIAGIVYADDDDNNAIGAGEGMSGITVTLTGTDAFGNAISVTTTTDGSGNYSFANLPPSDAAGYTLVETQDLAFYDLAETAGTSGGTVDNSAFGDAAAQNTISAIVLAASTDATGYIFQNHTNAVIDADNDNPASVVGATGGDDIINALDNDMFNGGPATISNIDITIVTPATPIGGGSVPVLDPATGLVDVPAGTPAGTYTIDYEICDEADPDNCAPATVTVIVTAAAIAAVDDSVTGINGFPGQSNVLNVLTDDTLNGAAATTANVDITVATGFTVPAGLTFDPATGNVSVDPGTAAGLYEFDYTICETLNPSNCSTATASVTVVAPPIVAVDDTETGINGLTGETDVLNVLTDDTINGIAATTTNVTITVAAGFTVPAGLTFDPATGSVSVDPGTPAGSYSFDYTICDVINPANCSTATATVDVGSAPIQAVDDSATGINGATGQSNVLNVLTDDTLNGAAATTGNVDITVATGFTVPAGLTFDPATGNVSVDPGTPAGTYTFDYTICETLNPANCSTATATVTVVAAPIVAVDDSVGGINGVVGQADVLDALADDTLNGVPATLATVTIELAPGATVPAGLTFDPATGLTSVDPGTAAGTYSFDYRICEILNPTNCAIATETVTVAIGPITADDDSSPPVNGATGGTGVVDALDGDMLNNAPVDIADVTITVLTPATPINGGPVPVLDPATGLVDVPPGTPAGTYQIEYEICEDAVPTNCASAFITVPVTAAPIQAVDDSETDINGATGQTNVLNVLTDDTLNGDPADISTVTITVATGSTVPAGLTFDPATGEVSVDPGTAAGTYSFDYTICEILNPTNCSTATATVDVVAAPILAVDDSATDINGATGANDVLNVLTGDTLNGVDATTGNVTIAVAPGATVPAGLTFDPSTGSVSVDPGTAAGTYSFDYEICEILNPTNCTTATATVTVIAAPIEAVDDSATDINGADGADDVLNVLTGDTLNGAPATTSNVTITLAPGATVPAGLTFDPATGNVSVDPGTPAGTYEFDYQICEILNPTNCTTATATVTVIAAEIEATPDTALPTNGSDGATGVIDVLPNDTLNGDPADLTTVDITVVTPATPISGAPVPVLDPATGLVDVPPGTPAGDYVIEYQICEELNPANCAVTTVTVPVIAAPIEAVDDTATDVNGADGASDVLNVLTGDTLNGVPATTSNVTIALAPGAVVPEGLTFDPATGSVSVEPGTPAGDYSFDYEICEVLNPSNCTTATVTVTVVASPIEANNDSATEIDGSNGQTDVVNVFDGDTINGQPATPDNAIVSLAPGSSLPPGITFDPVTGNVSVLPDTPEGDYSFEYQLCEALNPTNCTTATVNLNVVLTQGGISGVVFLDENLNRSFEGGEPLQNGWTVQVLQDGDVVATVQTDADGFYEVEELPAGGDYEVRFFGPNGGAQFGSLEDLTVTAGETLIDQNQPIDPSGVVYDAITRQPVTGAVVNLVDQFGNILPDVCYIDASQSGQITGPDGFYRFDIVAGADAACPVGRTEYAIQIMAPTGFADPISTVIAPEDGALNVAGLGDPAAVVPNTRAPQVGEPTTYYLSFLIAEGDANVVNNHIPLDPFTNRAALLVTKTSPKRTASVGELVPYTITVRNTEAADRADIDVVDILPPGFKYVPGSARVNDVPEEPTESVRELRWENQFIAGNATSVYSIIAVIGAGVSEGDRINTAVGLDGISDAEVSNRAQAVVTITASAIFDCAEIIGKVFDDFDGDGYQDEGEPGIPAARVATVNGELITTDEFGRYHITCAAVPNAQIGSNFVLKLDPRTIPDGYTPSTDNPQSIRLTRGKISELNFGVVKSRVIAIAIDERAFGEGVQGLKPAFAGKLADLAALNEQRLVIQITYSAKPGEDAGLIAGRLAGMRGALDQVFASDEWDGPPPTIETNMVRTAPSNEGGE